MGVWRDTIAQISGWYQRQKCDTLVWQPKKLLRQAPKAAALASFVSLWEVWSKYKQKYKQDLAQDKPIEQLQKMVLGCLRNVMQLQQTWLGMFTSESTIPHLLTLLEYRIVEYIDIWEEKLIHKYML